MGRVNKILQLAGDEGSKYMLGLGKFLTNVHIRCSHYKCRFNQLSSVFARGGENHLGCVPVHVMIFIPEVVEYGARRVAVLDV